MHNKIKLVGNFYYREQTKKFDLRLQKKRGGDEKFY